MEIIEWRQANTQFTLGQGAIDLLAKYDAVLDVKRVEKLDRLGQPLSDYVCLYAVEDGQVVSRIGVERRQWTTARGTQTVSAIVDVLTRPDALRRGYSEAIFEQVHARESKAGIRLVFLWTQKSWGAHQLYERLGYRDVFTHPCSIRLAPRRGTQFEEGYTTRIGRRSDAPLLESLLIQGTRGRVGFLPRFRGSFKLRLATGWQKAEGYRILNYRGRAVGYVYANVNGKRVVSYEAVVSTPKHIPGLLALLENLSKGKWLYIESTTFVRDADHLLRSRGYQVIPGSHAVLMVKSLREGINPKAVKAVCDNPLFFCHAGDKF
jgi:GNAT superfamily N-acetyltransferase